MTEHIFAYRTSKCMSLCIVILRMAVSAMTIEQRTLDLIICHYFSAVENMKTVMRSIVDTPVYHTS